ncbi:MAG: DUF2945 domain-containing protein [Kofleriaceae bacterium]
MRWNSEAGLVTGVIRKRFRAPTQFKGYTVRASAAEPQYLIESEKTDHLAVHKPGALRKLRPRTKPSRPKHRSPRRPGP